MKVLLSICIPTYNRADVLKISIESIVSQEVFQCSDLVEIVISDNCSQDNTEEFGKELEKQFYPKVRYYRNIENIKDRNFEKVLSYGNGHFLKLSNDTLIYNKGSLDFLLGVVHDNFDSKNLVFFTNGKLKDSKIQICNNLDQFVKTASYWSTWIACFGIWKVDFELLADFSRLSHMQLAQTDVIFRLISSQKKCIIYNQPFFLIHELKSKGGYNLFKVFGVNYFIINKKYLKSGELRKKTYNKEKYRLFRHYLIPRYDKLFYTQDKRFSFDKNNAMKYLFINYRFELYFYIYMFYLYLRYQFRKIFNYRKSFKL